MSSEIEIGIGLAKLKITLSEFASVVRNFAGEAKHGEVKGAIKELIGAARTSYDTTVDVLTPLYALDSEGKFDAELPALRSDFKNQYLKDMGRLYTHCSIVEAKIVALKDKQGVMRNIPLVNRSFNRLDRLAEAWLARDFELARDMEQFLGRMNDYLDEVNIHRQNDVTEAYQGLRSALELFEQDFLTTKRALDDLDVISSRL